MEEVQSWEEFIEVLEQIEWTPSQQVEGGTIFRPSNGLDEVLDDPGIFHSDWYFEDTPDGIVRNALLAMLWDSSGAPISWDGRLELIQVGEETAYVLLWLEGIIDVPEILGKVVPANTPAAYRTLFLEVARSGENFLLVPDHTSNGRPDLLDQETIRQGYWEMLQTADAQFGGAWEELEKRVDEPYPGLAYANKQNSEPQSKNEDPPLSEAERHALLDRYFEKNYEEYDGE